MRRRATRRASTLIEVLVMISLTGFILSLTGMMIARAARVQREFNSRLHLQRATGPLLQRLRSEAHRAQGAELTENGRTLRLELPEGIARYELGRTRILRVLEDHGGQRLDQDSAPLPPGARWRLLPGPRLEAGLVQLLSGDAESSGSSATAKLSAAIGIASPRQLGLPRPPAPELAARELPLEEFPAETSPPRRAVILDESGRPLPPLEELP